jgi:hypothetical protein
MTPKHRYLMVIVAGCALVGGSRMIHAAENRPFRLVGAGKAVFVSPVTATFAAQGVATHLGTYRVVGTIEVAATSNPQVLSFTGTAVLTAANLDTLRADLSGEFNLATGHASEFWRFQGGTGRFARASGSTSGSTENKPDGSFTLVLRGTIKY